MKHIHHIIPRHMGGTDELDNLIELSIEAHAEAHKELWEKHGNWQDKIAWRMLSGQITASEASKEAQKIGQKLGGKIQGQRSAQNGRLSRICTKDVQIAGGKARYEKHGHIHANMSDDAQKRYEEGHSKGGKIGGKSCFKNKVGIFAPENIGKGGRIGGKIGGKIAAKITNAMKFICYECGRFTNARHMSEHKKRTGHVLVERI